MLQHIKATTLTSETLKELRTQQYSEILARDDLATVKNDLEKLKTLLDSSNAIIKISAKTHATEPKRSRPVLGVLDAERRHPGAAEGLHTKPIFSPSQPGRRSHSDVPRIKEAVIGGDTRGNHQKGRHTAKHQRGGHSAERHRLLTTQQCGQPVAKHERDTNQLQGSNIVQRR